MVEDHRPLSTMTIGVCVSQGIHIPGPLPLDGAGDGGLAPLPEPNPLDERALEAAVRLREQRGGRVVLVAVGPMAEDVLFHYCGLAADEAVHIVDDGFERLSPEQVALVLARFWQQEPPDLILCGERCVNGRGTGLVPFALAANLGWPLLPAAAHIVWDGPRVTVERVVERGDREVLVASVPAVITVAEAHPLTAYPALANAYRARVRRLRPADLGLSVADLEEAAPLLSEVERRKARPRPRKLYVPPSTMSAADRLAALLGGSAPRGRSGGGNKFFEGPPDKAAEAILDFLRKEGMIGDRR